MSLWARMLARVRRQRPGAWLAANGGIGRERSRPRPSASYTKLVALVLEAWVNPARGVGALWPVIEQRVEITASAYDANDQHIVVFDSIQHDVVTDRECAQALGEFISSTTGACVSNEKEEPVG